MVDQPELAPKDEEIATPEERLSRRSVLAFAACAVAAPAITVTQNLVDKRDLSQGFAIAESDMTVRELEREIEDETPSILDAAGTGEILGVVTGLFGIVALEAAKDLNVDRRSFWAAAAGGALGAVTIGGATYLSEKDKIAIEKRVQKLQERAKEYSGEGYKPDIAVAKAQLEALREINYSHASSTYMRLLDTLSNAVSLETPGALTFVNDLYLKNVFAPVGLMIGGGAVLGGGIGAFAAIQSQHLEDAAEQEEAEVAPTAEPELTA